MKRAWIISLFIAGIVVGALSFNALSFFAASNTHGPLVSTSVDVQNLIQNISQSIRSKNLTLTKDRYGRFEEVFNVLESNYYYQDKIDDQTMIKAAIKSLVDSIDDPYTVYLDHVEYEDFQKDLKGTTDLEWIGAVVAKKDYYILIEEVLKESPAFNAGLRPLDRILAVDGESTKDETVNDAVMRIRGPKWTTVTLTIERVSIKDDSKEVFDLEVVRDTLTIPSVESEIIVLNKKNIGHVTISMIWEETETLLRKEILKLQENNIQWIILDLRGNGWGILPIAVQIASHFIPEGKLITTAKYQGYPDETFVSQGYTDLQDIPVVVLVDMMTASAGEIIALAMKEQIWATLIGTQTFGKWSIQTLYEFSDKDSLKYTIGRWYGPSGSTIDQEGIVPDVVVEFNVEQYAEDKIDNQLQEAIKVLQTKL